MTAILSLVIILLSTFNIESTVCRIFRSAPRVPCKLEDWTAFSRDTHPYPGNSILDWQYSQSVHLSNALVKQEETMFWQPEYSIATSAADADVIFIDDSCLWVAAFKSEFRKNEMTQNQTSYSFRELHQNLEDSLKVAWDAIDQSGRNQHNSHPWHPKVAALFPHAIIGAFSACKHNYLSKTIKVVIEERYICPFERNMTTPNFLVIPGTASRNRFAAMNLSRSNLLFFRGNCGRTHNTPIGNRLRFFVTKEFNRLNRTDVKVLCRSHLTQDELLSQLASTKYCLVLPGDSPSARRLSDVIAAGCIPVMIGPPFNELAWAQQLNYRSEMSTLSLLIYL